MTGTPAARRRGVGLALVAQHVGLVDDHERRRQPLELLVGRTQRRGERLRAPLEVGEVDVNVIAVRYLVRCVGNVNDEPAAGSA